MAALIRPCFRDALLLHRRFFMTSRHQHDRDDDLQKVAADALAGVDVAICKGDDGDTARQDIGEDPEGYEDLLPA